MDSINEAGEKSFVLKALGLLNSSKLENLFTQKASHLVVLTTVFLTALLRAGIMTVASSKKQSVKTGFVQVS